MHLHCCRCTCSPYQTDIFRSDFSRWLSLPKHCFSWSLLCSGQRIQNGKTQQLFIRVVSIIRVYTQNISLHHQNYQKQMLRVILHYQGHISCDVYGSSSTLWVKWHRTGLVSAKHVFLSSFSFKANWIRVLFFIILTLQYFHTKPIETSDLICLPKQIWLCRPLQN